MALLYCFQILLRQPRHRRPGRRTAPTQGPCPMISHLMARSGDRQGSPELLNLFFGIFRSAHVMNLPRLATRGILVYPLSGISQWRGPEVGAGPRDCCAARGEGLSKVVKPIFYTTQISEESNEVFFTNLCSAKSNPIFRSPITNRYL